jgi:RNA polymerase sigma-70 factor (ECF subfamily)
MTETDLLIQLKTGNKEALAELLALHRQTVLDICKHFLLSKEDAENVSRNVFVEIYNTAKNFRGPSKLTTFIYRIAIKKSLAEINKRKRRLLFITWGKALGFYQLIAWFADDQQPALSIKNLQELPLRDQALNRLHVKQRIALTLSEMQQCSNRRVAEIMDISLREADRLIYLGNQNVKLMLDAQLRNSIEVSADHNMNWIEEEKYLNSSTT